jgi:hypothetical protein
LCPHDDLDRKQARMRICRSPAQTERAGRTAKAATGCPKAVRASTCSIGKHPGQHVAAASASSIFKVLKATSPKEPQAMLEAMAHWVNGNSW